MDIEHKLNLIQQIHREQEENERYVYENLRQRNYSRRVYDFDDYAYDLGKNYRKDSRRQKSKETWFVSFRFRLLIALLFFLCFFVMEKKEIVYKEIGSAEIVQYISENADIQEFIPMKKILK